MGRRGKLPTSHGLSDVDYKKLKRENPPKEVDGLPKGVWVPISIAAFLLRRSGQTVRLLQMTKQLRSIKFPVGPILVDIGQFMVDEENPNEQQ